MTEEVKNRKRKDLPEWYGPSAKEQCIKSCLSSDEKVFSGHLRSLCMDMKREILKFIGIIGDCFSCGIESVCTQHKDYSLCACLSCKVGKKTKDELHEISRMNTTGRNEKSEHLEKFILNLGKSLIQKPLFCELCVPNLKQLNLQIKLLIQDSIDRWWEGIKGTVGLDINLTMLIHKTEYYLEDRIEFLSWRQLYALECLSKKIYWEFSFDKRYPETISWNNGPPLVYDCKLIYENHKHHVDNKKIGGYISYPTGCKLFTWAWT